MESDLLAHMRLWLCTGGAMSDADLPVDDASRIIARWRLAWYFASKFVGICVPRLATGGESSRTSITTAH